ncbi:hypothetical protein LCI18_009553 [Fusarium solani-melongenae]|uniref:Uncharacterized protein n=1 Tax=Fusarium solani subsp. cucurbitae TaxID=2747967 RepID=A0ACD3ZBF7_FUSSC|nr:hypothetical protein LCI18_009553 [Fusarium solani-melongenae]
MSAMRPVDDVIIIGIDFGTTFSGVAWAYSREPDEIELVTSWDSELNRCSDVGKAPTQLYYGKNGDATQWGYSIPIDKDPLKWFKLLLLDDKDVPSEVANSAQLLEARRLRKGLNKDPVEIIGCFLRQIWNHSIDSIKRSVGPDLLRRSKFHVIITVPAIWPHYAQQRMKQAANMSGILQARDCGETVLRFISEPEAAALATLRDLSKRSTIKAKDTIVVCDAGGGTVDLISYCIESTEPFVVKECVKGDGDLCGAVFVDENFINLIKRKAPPGSWESVTKAEERRFLNDGWEHGIKPQFENQRRIWPVDLPDSCIKGSSKGLKRRITVNLSSADILSVFSPIVDKIEALVSRQVEIIETKYWAPPKYIILVGGFGRSRYLFNRLEKKFKSTILQSRGDKPWTAICRGAVVRGLTTYNLSPNLGVKIQSRIARMSYGTKYHTRFISGLHDLQDKYWDECHHEYRAKDQMFWYLREGEDISSKHPVQGNWQRHFSGPLGQLTNLIFCTSTFPPPSRMDGTVRRLCEVTWNHDIDLESLPKWTNKIGKVYHKLGYNMEMVCEDGDVDFTVYHDGNRVGGQSVQVEFD